MLGLKNPSVLIVGSGPSGIAMAYNLKEVAGLTSEWRLSRVQSVDYARTDGFLALVQTS